MNETEDKPPSLNICQPITTGVRSGSNDRSIARRREVALLQHLSSPDLRSRFRNDLAILASTGLLS